MPLPAIADSEAPAQKSTANVSAIAVRRRRGGAGWDAAFAPSSRSSHSSHARRPRSSRRDQEFRCGICLAPLFGRRGRHIGADSVDLQIRVAAYGIAPIIGRGPPVCSPKVGKRPPNHQDEGCARGSIESMTVAIEPNRRRGHAEDVPEGFRA